MKPLEIQEQDLDAVIANEKTVLVDYYGEDCAYCASLAHILEDVSQEWGDALPIRKVFLASPEMPSVERYQIRGIPTLILFKDGQPVEKHGYLEKQKLVAVFAPYLGGVS